MLNRTKQTVWLALSAAVAAYACGDSGDKGRTSSTGGLAGAMTAGVDTSGNAAGGAAPGGGSPGMGGSAGSAGSMTVPVYEQDDPNLIPPETAYQRVEIPVSLSKVMGIDADRDDNLYILEREGGLRIWKADGAVVEAAALPVFAGNEDGGLGLALDPEFATNRFLYIFYTVEAATAGVGEHRLSRFLLEGDVLSMDSEKVLLTVPDERAAAWHVGGGMEFDSKGNLYLAIGDNTNPFESSGYSPIDETPGRRVFDAQRTAGNSQDLRGKILRIKPTEDGSYEIPEGNLFTADVGRPEIYVMGNRNPFRIALDRANDWLYWGEVGPDAGDNADAPETRGPRGYDEFNQAKAAGFFGWPYCVADNQPYRSYDFASGTPGAAYDCAAPANDSPNNTGAKVLPAAQPAWTFYSYATSPYPAMGTVGGRTALMGAVYRWAPGGSVFKVPRHFDGSKFIMEYSRGWINEVRTEEDGTIVSVEPFLPSLKWSELIDMTISPSGVMFVAQYGTNSTVYRVNYVGNNNQPPSAVLSSDRDSGQLPLQVAFSSEGSADFEGAALTYAWDFENDGTVDATEANPSFTYTAAGTYQAKLTVSDGLLSASALATIVAGNTRPVVTVSSPPNGAFIDQDELVDYSLSVTDAEDGSTPTGIPCSSVIATPALGHDIHEHDGAPTTGCTGTVTTATGIINTENTWQVLNVSYKDKGVGPLSLLGTQKLILHFKRVQAEHTKFVGESYDVMTQDTMDVGGGANVGWTNHGSYLCWNQMNFTGITSVTYRVAAGGLGGRIAIRQGGPTGTTIGTPAEVTSTGGWQTWDNVTVPLTNPGGTHKYCFVFERDPGDELLFNLNWIDFNGNGVSRPK